MVDVGYFFIGMMSFLCLVIWRDAKSERGS